MIGRQFSFHWVSASLSDVVQVSFPSLHSFHAQRERESSSAMCCCRLFCQLQVLKRIVLKTDIEALEVVIFITKTFKASIGVIPAKKIFKAPTQQKKSVPLSYGCHTEINEITILPPQNEL